MYLPLDSRDSSAFSFSIFLMWWILLSSIFSWFFFFSSKLFHFLDFSSFILVYFLFFFFCVSFFFSLFSFRVSLFTLGRSVFHFFFLFVDWLTSSLVASLIIQVSPKVRNHPMSSLFFQNKKNKAGQCTPTHKMRSKYTCMEEWPQHLLIKI